MTTIKRVCNLCEAMCGLNIELSGEQIISIRGNKDDVFSHGAFCPKSQGLKDLWLDPDRLRQPLKRVDGEFQVISWSQAFTEIAEKIDLLQKRYGRSSIASYAGNPNAHNFGNLLFLPLFLRALRSPNKYSATSVDQLPHMLVSYLMFGHQLLLPIADVDHVQYMLILGANPAVSNGSLLSSAGLSTKLKAIEQRGGKVRVIDPRYTETASLVSEHHFIWPGTDAFFLSGILKLMFAKKTVRLGRLRSLVKGFEALEPTFIDIDLEQVSRITGIATELMETIADELGSYETAICYGRVGVSTQAHGAICQWLINLINILSGNFDRRGTVLFTKPAVDALALSAMTWSTGSFARRRSRVHSLPEFSGEFPVATLADEILTEGKGQIRALITIAGNPVLTTPNGQKLEKALEQLDLQVAIDIYQNETSRLADYILPPTTALEHNHFDLVFNALASRNIARYSPTVVSSPKDAYEDWQILMELWARLDNSGSRLKRLCKFLIKKASFSLGTERILDVLLRLGPHRDKKLTVKKLLQHPDGIDLGPLESRLPERLFTSDKKINLTPEPLLEAWQAFRSAELWSESEARQPGELRMIGRRVLKSNNSWMHNLPSLARSKDPCYLLMHPSDAAERGIDDASEVLVRSSIGSIALPVKLSERIMPGVVSMPHGFGHHRTNTRQSLARQQPGVSLNDVMDDRQVDALSGNAVLNGQRVQVEAKPK